MRRVVMSWGRASAYWKLAPGTKGELFIEKGKSAVVVDERGSASMKASWGWVLPQSGSRCACCSSVCVGGRDGVG